MTQNRRLDRVAGDIAELLSELEATSQQLYAMWKIISDPEAKLLSNVGMWLTTRGHNGAHIFTGIGSMTSEVAERIEQLLGTSPRASRALALHMQLTAGFIMLFGEPMGLDEDTVNDVLAVARIQLLHSGPLVEQLGW
jgi:hypothetical protein